MQTELERVKEQYSILKGGDRLQIWLEYDWAYMVRVHNTFGIGERLHGPSRKSWSRIKVFFPIIPPKYVREVENKAKNDTIGENGFVSLPSRVWNLSKVSCYQQWIAQQKEPLKEIKVIDAEYIRSQESE